MIRPARKRQRPQRGELRLLQEGRAGDESRPWVRWARRLGVPADAPVRRLPDAARTFVRHFGLGAIEVLVAAEAICEKRHRRAALFLLHLVLEQLRASRTASIKAIRETLTAAYEAVTAQGLDRR